MLNVQSGEEVTARRMLELEEELAQLKEKYHIESESKWWHKIGDFIAEQMEHRVAMVNRKKYIKLALMGGWFCGAHRFYAKQKVTGIIYLLFCWSGIPLAMTLIDLMIALPKVPDENGDIIM